jgi:hypothetical protein
MDSDAHWTGTLVITALARNGSTAAESPSLAPAPVALTPSPARAGPIPETVWPEALAPRAPEGLSALIGALSLRAIRSRHRS